MDINNITQIEDFLLKNKKKTIGAVFCMTDIIGVLTNLKPASFIDFSSEEMEKADCLKFKEMLEKVGLKSIFHCHQIISLNKLEWSEKIFISKKFDTAVRLRNNFVKMWDSLDDFGQVIDQKTWTKTTRQIGKILGYPNTAIDAFVKNETEHRNVNNSLTITNIKYKAYAHSKKHLDKEVEIYDKPLDEAVKKYAPKIYNLSKEQTKRA